MKKKILALILACAVLMSAFAVPASAATVVTSSAERGFYRAVDKVIDVLVGGIAALIKSPDWVSKSDYVSENFYEGLNANEFLDAPAANAKWYVGYSNASLLTGKELSGDGDYYVGGSLSVTKKLATEVRDDQKVRTVAMSDGRGITIFSCLDAYGMANTDVRAIRKLFADYAEKEGLNITSVNISALHQHSCVDTFGMNGDIVSAVFTSCVRNILGLELPSGQNEDYMANLYEKTLNTMIEAVEGMESGTMYYGEVNVAEYIRDKRNPQVYDEMLHRLRFVPDNSESEETWIINGAIHCVGNGAAGTVLTGDYPYYMEKYINETAGANYFYIQGAELAITLQTGPVTPDESMVEEYGERYARLAAYGEKLGQIVCSITNETEVAPILNIRFTEVFVPISNNILVLAAKCGLLLNQVVRSGLKYEVVTEVGYAEFGDSLAVAIIPGELAPEIAFGGADTAAESWTGTNWNYPSFAEKAADKELIVFGITNDQIGYILNENSWHSYLTENEEIVSTGPKAGETIASAYLALFDEVK